MPEQEGNHCIGNPTSETLISFLQTACLSIDQLISAISSTYPRCAMDMTAKLNKLPKLHEFLNAAAPRLKLLVDLTTNFLTAKKKMYNKHTELDPVLHKSNGSV